MRVLPWDYGVRNLLRRPLRTVLTVLGLVLVGLLLLVVVGFERSLAGALRQSGEEGVLLIHALVAADNLENSSIPDQINPLVRAELGEHVATIGDTPCLSPELMSSTILTQADGNEQTTPKLAVFRGVRPEVFSVRRQVAITAGQFPKAGEILVGRLAATKLGISDTDLALGQTLTIEGKAWRVSGHFAAPGTLLESEIWCPLDELRMQIRRPSDLSVLAVRLRPDGDRSVQLEDFDYFCKYRHRDLEIGASLETTYYGSLQRHFKPLQTLTRALVLLVAIAGLCGAINTTYAAVSSRIRELAALQAMGFSRLAIGLSLVQESVLMAALGTLTATALAMFLLRNVAVRFSMSAFTLQLDAPTLATGCVVGLLVGVVGALPPLWRAFRLPIVEGLRAL